MNRSRLLVPAAVLLAAAAFLLFAYGPGDPGSPAADPGKPGEASDPATAHLAQADTDRQPAPAQRQVVRDPDAKVYTIRGRVLSDARLPLADMNVVAFEGQATDRSGPFSGFAKARPGRKLQQEDMAMMTSGDVLARTAVAPDGAFLLETDRRHLRLRIEHDFYGLATPEIVHVPVKEQELHIVLSPYLGGHLRGRLLGGDPGAVREVSLLLQPDMMSAVRAPDEFLGAILQMATSSAKPVADGSFEFRAVIPGAAITLVAEGDEVAGRGSFPALAPGERREAALRLERALSVEAKVVDARGEAVANARVTAARAETNLAVMAKSRIRERTAADGTARLAGLLPGDYDFVASARGHVSAELTTAVPTQGQLTLRLGDGGTVTGIVVDPDGNPLADARVAPFESMDIPMLGDLSSQLGMDLIASVARDGESTDAEGKFRLTGLLGETTFHLVAAHDDFSPGMVRDASVGDSGLRIELQAPTALVGRVVDDADGAAVPGFTIELATTMFLIVDRPVALEEFAADDGAFELTSLIPDDYKLVVTAEGFSPKETSVSLAPGKTLDVGEVRLVRESIVRGVVVDGDNRPVPDALVQRLRGGMLDNPVLTIMLGTNSAVRTDDDGRFELRGLPTGRLTLSADAEGFASGRSDRLKLEPGEVRDDVVIALDHGGSVAGTVAVGPGEHVDQFRVLVQDVATQRTFETTPDPDGSFVVDNLMAGRYQVQAMHPAALAAMAQQQRDFRPGQRFDFGSMMSQMTENVVMQRCVVRPGETTTVDLDATDLGSGVRLRLAVFVGGEPLTEGVIEATTEDGNLRTGFLLDGEAVFGALRAGQLRVQVRSGITLTPVGAPQIVRIPSGSDRHEARLDLPGGALRGRVVDMESGTPLPAVVVHLRRDDSASDDELLGMGLTGADGSFVFRGLPPGNYGLVASNSLVAGGDSTSRRDGIELLDGAEVTGIELRAQPAAGVTVIVRDGDGAPVPGAMVVAVDDAGRPLGAFAIAIADGAGKARIGGLARGRVRIVGRGPGLAPGASEPLEAFPGQRQEVPLTLHRGTRVILDAFSREGVPLNSANIVARCNSGIWFPAVLLIEQRNGDGRVELGRLSPGLWEFRVDHPASGSFLVSRQIPDGATVTVVATPPQ